MSFIYETQSLLNQAYINFNLICAQKENISDESYKFLYKSAIEMVLNNFETIIRIKENPIYSTPIENSFYYGVLVKDILSFCACQNLFLEEFPKLNELVNGKLN